MVEWRRILVAVVAILVATVAVQADLTTVSPAKADRVEAVCPSIANEQRPADSLASLGVPSGFDLGLPAIDNSDEPEVDGEEGTSPVGLVTLVDRSDSVDLCLYALLGLGLCRSGHWVKKSSLGLVPDWYHHDAPFQVGHSHLIGPDCLGSNLACFIQPETMPEELEPNHHQGPMAPLFCKSLCTPTVRASRGPPA